MEGQGLSWMKRALLLWSGVAVWFLVSLTCAVASAEIAGLSEHPHGGLTIVLVASIISTVASGVGIVIASGVIATGWLDDAS